ncbi:MAG: hypothetical protein ACUVXI_17210 [bacterium]
MADVTLDSLLKIGKNSIRGLIGAYREELQRIEDELAEKRARLKELQKERQDIESTLRVPQSQLQELKQLLK